MSGIKLFVGLGNPGEKYIATRHNAGFWWIDEVAAQTNSKLTLDAKFFGVVGKLNAKPDTWLLKPTTFMNGSGKSVAALANYYKITPAEILVIHDELDLPAGGLKLKVGGGHGGHNGLKDIEAALGTKDFWRLRLGIGHPGDRNEVINFVLKAATKDEQAAIDEKVYESTKLIDLFLAGNFESAMLKLHTKK
ncbi:MAG: aminoacyl-tRNA hydrolase [Methylotenera sp.]|uniref:aminoacyl-tRNA hydrolase n=1 Tax=Methylotenera sp. TaxID=2051956 RepID=UPI002489F747|nr:aminoacyl-tRNA hydrolase [Methylotenera sp.]MDI1310490.1 aminoacyl-tRNA hydrolase [Methylotenera sp.]